MNLEILRGPSDLIKIWNSPKLEGPLKRSGFMKGTYMIGQTYPGYAMPKSPKILSTSTCQIITDNWLAYIYPTKSLVMKYVRHLIQDLEVT